MWQAEFIFAENISYYSKCDGFMTAFIIIFIYLIYSVLLLIFKSIPTSIFQIGNSIKLMKMF